MQTIPEEWQRRASKADGDGTPFDFIVVGAGAGGAPLAARLVERGFRVLVIEMGPKKPEKPADALVENTEVPVLHTETTEDPRHSLQFYVKHFDHDPYESQDPKVHLPDHDRTENDEASSGNNREGDDAGIFYPRAQGVGGCTIHNAMITVCGPWSDWDEIAEATNDPSWRGGQMRRYFERLEDCLYDRPLTWFGWLKQMILGRSGWEGGRHGHGGWLQTSFADLRLLQRERKFARIIFEASIGALRTGAEQIKVVLRQLINGSPGPVLDPNHWETMQQSQAGLSMIPSSITADGRRSGPRERLLGAEQNYPEHLTILSEACVTQVVLEDANGGTVDDSQVQQRAVGVKVFPRAHAYEADAQAKPVEENWADNETTIYCRREVILCGGAFNTPQLLMLSGIGDPNELRDQGIDVKVELSGVGKNLQDRYEVPVFAKLTDRFRSLDSLALTSRRPSADEDVELERWRNQSGNFDPPPNLCGSNGGLFAIIARSQQESTVPDLFLFALSGRFGGYEPGYSKPASLQPGPSSDSDPDAAADHKRYLTWLVLKSRTRNNLGYVRLRSKSPFRRPEINFRSFPAVSNDDQLQGKCGDLDAIHEGVQIIKEILETGQKKGTIEQFSLPGIERFKDEHAWIRHTAWGHHACGTCRIGPATDRHSVLDSRFRVRHVEGLRVVDASVFPRIYGYFIVTNVYMISEKAADVVCEDHADASGPGTARDPVLPTSRDHQKRRAYPVEFEADEAALIRERRRRAGSDKVKTELSPEA